jgi:hypothetical protein
MTVIETVMTLWGAMSMAEKKELILAIGEASVKDGLVSEEDVKSAPKAKKGKKSGKRMPYKPYWIKSVDGVDDTKKGMFRIEGEWVNDVQKDVSSGNMVIVGTKHPKHYYLAKRKDGASLTLATDGGDMTVPHLVRVTDADRFAGVEAAITKALAA